MRRSHKPSLLRRLERAKTRVGLMVQNAGDLMRLGHFGEAYGAPFDVHHEEPTYRLRRYARAAAGDGDPVLLFVPPLMVASEIYDISPELSAVAYLVARHVDVWMVDYGAPEFEPGGMERTLDDHVLAVVDAVRRTQRETGRPVHLAGYSQGGMFCYQAAAYLKAEGLASIITFGSPVDIHRNIPGIVDGLAAGFLEATQRAFAEPLSRVEGLPGMLTSTGFKLFSARKEVAQLVDFVKKLHDRDALERREASRRFLGGEGFVAWPGPAFRQFIDEFVVANRMTSGGFVIAGRTVTLADIDCPILYFVGERDDMARPPSVRAIRHAAPRAELSEVAVPAGHFGLVVGRRSREITWPTVIEWLTHVDAGGPLPRRLDKPEPPPPPADGTEAELDDVSLDGVELPLELFYDAASDAARAVQSRVRSRFADLERGAAQLRWQLPRLARLSRLEAHSRASLSHELAARAKERPDDTFFLYRGRAFSYAQADARVSAVVRGLHEAGVGPGQLVAVAMESRPSYLSLCAALVRIGAIPLLFDPARLPLAEVFERADVVVADPEHAEAARLAARGPVLVLGGGGRTRSLPAGVVDLEAIDPAAVELPAHLALDAGRAGELGIVFVRGSATTGLREARVTHGRLMLSALGVAGAAALRSSDTIYSPLSLHHPAGMLVAVGGALVGGSRLALSDGFSAERFWPEVRRAGATVVFYANDMCRALVNAPAAVGEDQNPVRLFAGSGMRPDVWRRLTERFHAGVMEFYATTQGSAVLANASGHKRGSVGTPLPGSAEVVLADFDPRTLEPRRDPLGRVIEVKRGEGLLLSRELSWDARFSGPGAREPVVRGVSEADDRFRNSGDILRRDADGDFEFVGQARKRMRVGAAWVSARPVEDALLEVDAVREAFVFADESGVLSAALVLRGEDDDLELLGARAAEFEPEWRPQSLHILDAIPLTAGFRPDVDRLTPLLAGPHRRCRWDAAADRYVGA